MNKIITCNNLIHIVYILTIAIVTDLLDGFGYDELAEGIMLSLSVYALIWSITTLLEIVIYNEEIDKN